jgi:phosphatidylglycerophosphatase A
MGVAMHVAAWSVTDSLALRVGLIAVGLLLICWGHFAVTTWSINYWNDKDPKNFVLDEVAGYLVVPLLHPHGNILFVAVAGFLLFRIFDIIKIPPARQIDRDWVGAWGILLDDIVSAVYAVIVLYGIEHFIAS